MTWWGSSFSSFTNELTGTNHMGYFISTAVSTIRRRTDLALPLPAIFDEVEPMMMIADGDVQLAAGGGGDGTAQC